MKRSKILRLFGLLILAGLIISSCAPAAEAPAAEEAAEEAPAAEEPAAVEEEEKIVIGLSFAEFQIERFKREEVLMRTYLEEKGYEVITQEAAHDAKLQNDQIDNMVAQGAKVIIVLAEDGDAAITAVESAEAEGVKIIAYDRLIYTDALAAYVSFDGIAVGNAQAEGIMVALDIENWDVAADGPAKIVKLGGSPTDNNAILFRQGQDQVLDPLEAAGTIEIVADQWVDNWDQAVALSMMENILTSLNNEVDAVVSSNDGTGLGVVEALKGQNLVGLVPVSGQDATAEACNSVVKGELTLSILKDIRNLAPIAAELADKLAKGEDLGLEMFTLTELSLDDSRVGEVACSFLPVVAVTKDNVYDLVVVSGFQSYEDVYRDIPEADLPAKP